MVVILTLMACPDQAQFRHDADVATCAWKEDCYGEDFNVCLETAEGQTETTGCFFEEQEARQCVRGLEQMACPEEGSAPVFPEVCQRVWTCPD